MLGSFVHVFHGDSAHAATRLDSIKRALKSNLVFLISIEDNRLYESKRITHFKTPLFV